MLFPEFPECISPQLTHVITHLGTQLQITPLPAQTISPIFRAAGSQGKHSQIASDMNNPYHTFMGTKIAQLKLEDTVQRLLFQTIEHSLR
jgi:hypothetical protein